MPPAISLTRGYPALQQARGDGGIGIRGTVDQQGSVLLPVVKLSSQMIERDAQAPVICF